MRDQSSNNNNSKGNTTSIFDINEQPEEKMIIKQPEEKLITKQPIKKKNFIIKNIESEKKQIKPVEP